MCRAQIKKKRISDHFSVLPTDFFVFELRRTYLLIDSVCGVVLLGVLLLVKDMTDLSGLVLLFFSDFVAGIFGSVTSKKRSN